MRSTSIGVEYLDARVGVLEPGVHQLFAQAVHVWRELKEGADNEPMERRASHGLGARAGLVLRPDCVVVLEVDLASVAHAVAWDFEFTCPNSVQRLRKVFGRSMMVEVGPACACVHTL